MANVWKKVVTETTSANISQNSATATALATGGTLTFTGDVAGGTTPTYTGGGNLSIAMSNAINSVDGTHIALGSDAQGDVMYYSGTNWVRLAAGTDGDVLTTGGTSANPAWETPTHGDITGVTAGVGLSGGASSGDATLTVDFSEFSAVTPTNGDSLATLDTDGSTEQRTTIAALATLLSGTGLTATNSVIAVDASQTQITAVGTITTGTWSGNSISDARVDNDLTISGGTVDNSVIGGTTAAAATFTSVTVNGATPIVLEGATADAYETSIAVVDPTADRTITLPNATGTVCVSGGTGLTLSAAGDMSLDTITSVAGNFTVGGTLTVTGATITVDTETIKITDNTLVLNSDNTSASAVDSGFVVELGAYSDNNANFWYNAVGGASDTTGRWVVGSTDDANPTIGGYAADVMQVRIDGSAIHTTSSEVPVGHMQYHNGELYLRVENS